MVIGCGCCLVVFDLKSVVDVEIVFKLIEFVDVLFEGFCSGVMECMGFGLDVVLVCSFVFVYGCMIGWGQEGFLL